MWTLVAAGLALVLTGLFLVRLAIFYWNAADYPGAEQFGKNNLYKVIPELEIRQDASYLSNDPFNAIYNFYSHGFELGPEKRAEGVCIEMMNSFNYGPLIQRDMSVTLCETPKGRMIFITRILSVRFH